MRVWPSEGEDKAWPKLDSKTNSQIWAPGLPPPSLDLKCSPFSQILELIYCLDFLHFLLLRSVRISEHMFVVFLWIYMGKTWFSSVYHQVNTFLLYLHIHPRTCIQILATLIGLTCAAIRLVLPMVELSIEVMEGLRDPLIGLRCWISRWTWNQTIHSKTSQSKHIKGWLRENIKHIYHIPYKYHKHIIWATWAQIDKNIKNRLSAPHRWFSSPRFCTVASWQSGQKSSGWFCSWSRIQNRCWQGWVRMGWLENIEQ